MQTVSSVDHEPFLVTVSRRIGDALQLLGLLFALRVCIATRMQLDDRRARAYRGIQLFPVRVDE